MHTHPQGILLALRALGGFLGPQGKPMPPNAEWPTFGSSVVVPLGFAIGVLVVAIPGSVRMWQLRRALRKNVPDGKAK